MKLDPFFKLALLSLSLLFHQAEKPSAPNWFLDSNEEPMEP